MQCIIMGPEDTPYEGGCFIFDIMCGPSYPSAAPKVLLFTTGGGSVRFNPNLYNCGKVCLSLLGTWSGDQGESWHANLSAKRLKDAEQVGTTSTDDSEWAALRVARQQQ